MATIDAAEPLAGEMIADRLSPLAARLDAYAGGIADRFDRFGLAEGPGHSPLLDALTARWTLPDRLDGGLELFDLDGFSELTRSWTARTGYIDAQYRLDVPYVVPVDPAAPTPLDAGRVMRGRAGRPAPATALRPVVPRSAAPAPAAAPPAGRASGSTFTPSASSPSAAAASRLTPSAADRAPQARLPDAALDRALVRPSAARAAGLERTDGPTADSAAPSAGRQPATLRGLPAAVDAPVVNPRERWRAVDERRISVYPAAMGRAGAIDAGLVRFPEARARIGGERPGVLAGPPTLDLVPDRAGLVPAARGAERLLDALVDRLVPAPATPVQTWLVPVGEPADDAAFPRSDALRAVAERLPPGAPRAWRYVRGARPAFAVPAAARVADAPRWMPGGAWLAGPERAPGLGERLLAAAEAMEARGEGFDRGVEPGLYDGPVADAGEFVAPVADRAAPPAGSATAKPAPVTPASSKPTSATPAAAMPAAETPARGADAHSSGTTAPDRALVRPAAGAAAPAGDERAAPEGRPTPSAARGTGSAPLGSARLEGRRVERLAGTPGERAAVGRAAGVARAFLAGGLTVPRPVGSTAEVERRDPMGAMAGVGAGVERLLDGRSDRPMLGARAWLLDALRGGHGDAAAAEPAGAPGATGLGARGLAERLAVTLGDVPLLGPGDPLVVGAARFADPVAFAAGGAFDPLDATLVAPVADRAPAAAAATAPRPSRRDAARAEPAPSAPAAVPASAESAPAVAGPATPPAEARPAGDVGRAAAAWAGRVGARLQSLTGPDTARAPERVAGVVARIEQQLIAGATPSLVEALRRFEAADEPVAGARAWRAVVAEAGLDAVAGALVAPVADRIASATTVPQAAAARPSARRDVRPPVATPSVFERRMGRLPAIGGAQAGLAAALAASSVDGFGGMSRAATFAPSARAGAPATTPGATPAAPTAAGLAGPRTWALDPAGRRWLVPVLSPAAAPSAASPASAAEAPIGAPAAGYVARRRAAVEALAERIAAAASPAAVDPLAIERAFARLAPSEREALSRAGVVPGAWEAVGAVVAPQGAEGSAARAVAAGASSALRRGQRSTAVSAPRAEADAAVAPLVEAARRMARLASRPGAVGAAVAGLAERIESRPALAPRRMAGARPAAERAALAAGVEAVPGAVVTGAAVAGEAPSGAVSAGGPGRASAQAPAGGPRFASMMDPAALLTGATAPEARIPERLARWWAAAAAPESESDGGAYAEAGAARVVVSPGGAAEAVAGIGGSGGIDGGLPGGRTSAAALRAFERARGSARSRAAAVGRPSVPSDVGALLVAAGADALSGSLFGDRGPAAIKPPAGAGRVLVETGRRAAGAEAMRSAAGEGAAPKTETNDEARHRLASQTEGDLSPEELEELATEVIARLRREQEFDATRFGADEWD